MSCCWNCFPCCCRRQSNYLSQAQEQAQLQAQAQAQAQDQDQNQRSIFRDIGNVNITIDNENIAVSVLAILGVLLGGIGTADVQSLLDRYLPARTV